MNKYKGFLLATAGGVAAATAAQAADLPVKYQAVAPAPVTNWTGWYFGGNIGAAWQTVTTGYTYFDEGQASYTRPSFMGGLQGGYNWQSGMLVLGWEGDISWSSKPNGAEAVDVGKGNALQGHITWLATARARAGLASGNALVYATAGLAVGGTKNTWSPNGILACDPLLCAKSGSKTKFGYVVGGGLEYMLSRNWTVGAEMLYVDLGSNVIANSAGDKKAHFRNEAVIARIKANFLF